MSWKKNLFSPNIFLNLIYNFCVLLVHHRNAEEHTKRSWTEQLVEPIQNTLLTRKCYLPVPPLWSPKSMKVPNDVNFILNESGWSFRYMMIKSFRVLVFRYLFLSTVFWRRSSLIVKELTKAQSAAHVHWFDHRHTVDEHSFDQSPKTLWCHFCFLSTCNAFTCFLRKI